MNLTGKQKSQILISLLEETSSSVLKELSEESSKVLSESLEDIPELDSKDQSVFLENALDLIKSITFESSSTPEELEETADSDIDELSFEGELEGPEEEIEEQIPAYPNNYRSAEVIAKKLSEQSIQLIAFFLAQVEAPLKTEIEDFIEQDILEDVKNVDVEMVPISKKVFQKLFDFIVLKQDCEDEEQDGDEEGDSSLAF
jgi:flagellar motor switch protein FliG